MLFRRFWIFLGVTVLFVYSCVDRIQFDTTPTVFPVALDGFISDQPGPYEVRVTRAFDIESKNTPKTPLTVKRLELFDSEGGSETLQETETGVYQTQVDGMRGFVGRAYWVKVELLDGRVYQSVPDTLQPRGEVEDVRFQFLQANAVGGAAGFNVTFDAKASNSSENYFLWRFVGTYQIETNPELADQPCGEARCPTPRPCSGYALQRGNLVQISPCTCCVCWVDFFNDVPILSDNRFVENGRFQNLLAGFVPLNQWIFLRKVYVRVEQRSLSRRSFLFWKAIKDQKEAANSLFQPISGRLPRSFIQQAGPTGNLEGIFYATSIDTKGVFITREDVPNTTQIPPVVLPFRESCLDFPFSTTAKPTFWN